MWIITVQQYLKNAKPTQAVAGESRSDEAWKRYTKETFSLTKMLHCDCWTDCTTIKFCFLTNLSLMMLVDNDKHTTISPIAQNHTLLTMTSRKPYKVCCVSLAHAQLTFLLPGQSQRVGCFDFVRVWQLVVSGQKCGGRFGKKFGRKTFLCVKIWGYTYCQ